MKKLIALLLAAVMCFSLVACSGGETPNTSDNNSTDKVEHTGGEANGNNSQEENNSNTTDDNNEDIADILCGCFNWYSLNGRKLSPLMIERNGEVSFAISGTWVANGRMCEFTTKDGEKLIYELKSVGDNHFLIGNENTFVPNGQVLTDDDYTVVELTLENWQEYLETVCVITDTKDMFGEITGQETNYYLQIKSNYIHAYDNNKSEILIRYTQNGSETDRRFGGIAFPPFTGILDPGEYPLEIVKIQGTIYLVNGL